MKGSMRLEWFLLLLPNMLEAAAINKANAPNPGRKSPKAPNTGEVFKSETIVFELASSVKFLL